MSKTHAHVAQPSSFAFAPENLEQAKAVIARYPAGRQQSAVMPLLDIAQRQEGWVTQAAMEVIAEMLDMAPIRVQEVATFYTRQPMGKHHVQVCTNICCQLRDSDGIVKAVQDTLGVQFGETTPDNLFTVSEVECLGACVNAPMMQIDDDFYEDLTPESTRTILEALRQGQTPKTGPQNGRQFSAPEGGPTTLLTLAKTGENA